MAHEYINEHTGYTYLTCDTSMAKKFIHLYINIYKYKLKAGFRPLDVFPLSVRPSSYDW